jgi:hypothetical protein
VATWNLAIVMRKNGASPKALSGTPSGGSAMLKTMP